MENEISKVSEFYNIQQNKRGLEIKDQTENLKKCQKNFPKNDSFPKTCRKKSLKSIEKKDLYLIHSQEGILYRIIKKFYLNETELVFYIKLAK